MAHVQLNFNVKKIASHITSAVQEFLLGPAVTGLDRDNEILYNDRAMIMISWD